MALVTHPRFRRHCQTIFLKTEIRPISSPFVSQLQFSPNPVFLLISLSYLINFKFIISRRCRRVTTEQLRPVKYKDRD